jgi:putative ABC transport system substrate-binding protein
MRKKTDLIVIVVSILFLVLPAFSEAGVIAALKSAAIKPYDEAIEGFEQSCDCDLRQVTLSENGRSEALDQIRDMNPSAIFAVGLDALNLAREVRGIPLIYSMVPQSPAAALAPTTASGVSMYVSPEKFVSAMLEVFPNAKRIGVTYDARHSEAFIREADDACRARGVTLVARKTSRPEDFPSLIDGMKDKIDLFWMVPDATVVNPESVKYLLLFSFRNRVPVFAFSRKYVEMGATAGLYAAPRDMGFQAGQIARKILAGKNGSPVRVDVGKTVLVINRKIAGKLGIKISSEVLSRAEDAN